VAGQHDRYGEGRDEGGQNRLHKANDVGSAHVFGFLSRGIEQGRASHFEQ